MFFPQCSNLKSLTALSLESRCWPCQLCAKNAFSWVAFLGIFKLMVVAAGDDPGKFHPCRHKAGSAETCQPPQGIRGFSALSLCHGTDWACSHQAKKNFYIPAHRKAGRAAGERAHLGEGRFLLERGDLCCSPSRATHWQTWNNENKKFGRCLCCQFLSISLPCGLSCPLVNSYSNQAPRTSIRLLLCVFQKNPHFPDITFKCTFALPPASPLLFNYIHLDCLKEVLPFLIEYSFQTLAENYHTPYLAKIYI